MLTINSSSHQGLLINQYYHFNRINCLKHFVDWADFADSNQGTTLEWLDLAIDRNDLNQLKQPSRFADVATSIVLVVYTPLIYHTIVHMYIIRDPHPQTNNPTPNLYASEWHPTLRLPKTGHRIYVDTSTRPDLQWNMYEQGSCYRWPCQLTKIFVYRTPTLPLSM